MDWIDEILDDTPEQCTVYQLTTIETLMQTSAASFMYEHTNFEQMTYQEAEMCIQVLVFNNRPIDPRS